MVSAPLDYRDPGGPKLQIYWERFYPQSGKSKGSVFFLAGGPLPHFIFHGKDSPYFIKDLFAEYDFYMFDYRGTNCSSRVQSIKELSNVAKHFDIGTLASDVITLKNNLVGKNSKIILFGGSFGFLIGSKILNDFPTHIERAILFSGDTDSRWFYDSMDRLDEILVNTLPKSHPDFSKQMLMLLDKLERGKITLKEGRPEQTELTQAMFEMFLWFGFSQSVTAQERIPKVVSQTLAGDVSELESLFAAYKELKKTASPEPPPTLKSSLLDFYKCNVFFSKRTRRFLTYFPSSFNYLSTEGLTAFWNEVCAPFDVLPSAPFNISSSIKDIGVPVLGWVGDRDWFFSRRVERHLRKFGSKVEFHVMSGWSHDFGSDSAKGIATVKRMIEDFLARTRAHLKTS